MEAEHGLISSLLEWAGRRVDDARAAETVAEGLGGAQLPSASFPIGSSHGDMDVSFCSYVQSTVSIVYGNFDSFLMETFLFIGYISISTFQNFLLPSGFVVDLSSVNFL
jgi:hypothetical protein